MRPSGGSRKLGPSIILKCRFHRPRKTLSQRRRSRHGSLLVASGLAAALEHRVAAHFNAVGVMEHKLEYAVQAWRRTAGLQLYEQPRPQAHSWQDRKSVV